MATRKRNEEEQKLWDIIEARKTLRREMVNARGVAFAALDDCERLSNAECARLVPDLAFAYIAARKNVVIVEDAIRQLEADYRAMREKNDTPS